MRGKTSRQPSMWYTIDLEEMVAADHPLRPIKRLVDAELSRMSERFSKALPITVSSSSRLQGFVRKS